MSKSYSITTFGCQMNEHDSEILAGMLENLGYIEAEEMDTSDVIVLNTCSVRENADLRFFGNLGQLKHIKKKYPKTIIAVCGCMMQQEHIVDTIKKKYPFVDIVFGTHNLHEFPDLLIDTLSNRSKHIKVWEEAGRIVEDLPSKRKFETKALINITYGCNNFCTYCIVPYTRGRERSRKPSDIINEITSLAGNGTKEVMLLGQNVNSYGKTLDEKTDFADLLYQINEINGIERIRFMTSHPKDLSKYLVKAMTECNKICKHIHLPVQSGSTRVLERMNRKYTKEHYLGLVDQLKANIKDIAITTDIIVGFPGETEDDFNETLDLVRTVRYDSAFTFIYSPRKGTPAENYEDTITMDVKKQWFNQLVSELNNISLEKNSAYMDKIVDVLVEGKSKTDPTKLSGRTSSNKLVNFSSEKNLNGQIVPLKITKTKTFSLEGEII